MDFQVPRITREEVDEHRGRFVIEPLDRGFGYTFGNSLRRVLLSSLEGAAVTSVKIEGVAHEFTTLPGVREDVIDIILNLKSLTCRLHGESPEIEVRLEKRGPGQVTAADIEAPADLEVLNPDLEIANLADKGRIEMILTIGRGRGYVPAELNRGPEHTIGVIPVDSIFSPVRRVSYEVEAARVGQRTDYDKLTLDITTDGSVDPKQSVADAAEILIRQLAIFTDIERIEGFSEAAEAETEIPQARGMENFPIEELELGVRSYNCLKRVGIETIGDLVSKTENELAAIPNFGKKSIEEVKETLATHGLTLRERLGRAPPEAGTEARARPSAPQGALREPLRCADRARPYPDDRGEGEGGAPDRRGDDHARQARRRPRPPAGGRLPPFQGGRLAALQRGGAALRRSAGRLYASGQDRPAAGRCRADGLPRARRPRAAEAGGERAGGRPRAPGASASATAVRTRIPAGSWGGCRGRISCGPETFDDGPVDPAPTFSLRLAERRNEVERGVRQVVRIHLDPDLGVRCVRADDRCDLLAALLRGHADREPAPTPVDVQSLGR